MIKKGKTVLRIVANDYGITVDQIKGPSRAWPLPEARQMLCYLLKEHGATSVCKLINRDRTTFYRSVQKLSSLASVYPDVRKRFQRLSAKINQL